MGTYEEPLRQRFCRGIDCGRVFWICRHCYRGHKYCSLRCRQKTRGQQIRTAKRKHQKSQEGRDDHRDRNRAYRARRRRQRVTYHTSPPPPIRTVSTQRSLPPLKTDREASPGRPDMPSAPNLSPPASSAAVHAAIFRHPMWALTPQRGENLTVSRSRLALMRRLAALSAAFSSAVRSRSLIRSPPSARRPGRRVIRHRTAAGAVQFGPAPGYHVNSLRIRAVTP